MRYNLKFILYIYYGVLLFLTPEIKASNEITTSTTKENDSTTHTLALYGKDNIYISAFPVTKGSDKLSTSSVRFFEIQAYAPISFYKDLSTTDALKVFYTDVETTLTIKRDVYSSVRPLFENHKMYYANSLDSNTQGILFWHESRLYVLGFYWPEMIDGYLSELKVPLLQRTISNNICKYIRQNRRSMKRWHKGNR